MEARRDTLTADDIVQTLRRSYDGISTDTTYRRAGAGVRAGGGDQL